MRALSRRFRGKMVSLLRASADAGELHRVTRPGEVDAVLDTLMGTDWVVYTKSCLNHTATVVSYLAHYTHRIAITNARLLSVDDEGVLLRFTDYRNGQRDKTPRLSGTEFVRRFLLHIPPEGLMRIRHYGFLANRCRQRKLARIRAALARIRAALALPAEQDDAAQSADSGDPSYPCPECRRGRLRILATILPGRCAAVAPFR